MCAVFPGSWVLWVERKSERQTCGEHSRVFHRSVEPYHEDVHEIWDIIVRFWCLYRHGDNSTVLFSNFVSKINRKFVFDPRIIVLTQKCLYILKYTKIKVRLTWSSQKEVLVPSGNKHYNYIVGKYLASWTAGYTFRSRCRVFISLCNDWCAGQCIRFLSSVRDRILVLQTVRVQNSILRNKRMMQRASHLRGRYKAKPKKSNICSTAREHSFSKGRPHISVYDFVTQKQDLNPKQAASRTLNWSESGCFKFARDP